MKKRLLGIGFVVLVLVGFQLWDRRASLLTQTYMGEHASLIYSSSTSPAFVEVRSVYDGKEIDPIKTPTPKGYFITYRLTKELPPKSAYFISYRRSISEVKTVFHSLSSFSTSLDGLTVSYTDGTWEEKK